ncbi:hypothetical protein TRVA0_116S00100 [Trichomonascus vanleenenianus]|uniref:uncharacterized protein n=1 Tax=Trichomonascus vanleenenianus TaxID=2268995 RepID=UPI003ECA65BA
MAELVPPGYHIAIMEGSKKLEQLLRAKRKKGYKDVMIDATFESANIEVKENVIETALEEIKYNDEKSKELVKTISSKNVHKITNATSIVFDSVDGLFKTPLGVVQRVGFEQAMTLLDSIEKLLPNFLELREKEPDADLGLQERRSRKKTSEGEIKSTTVASDALKAATEELIDLNEQYFVIIPNRVANAREIENLLFSQMVIDQQKSTCNALLDTLNLIDDLKKAKLAKVENPAENTTTFNVEIEELTNKETFSRICDMYENSKNSVHGYFNTNTKIANIYKIKLESQQEGFDRCEQAIGNVMELWHGTRTQNLLSIMSKGLLLPKLSPGQKAGAMFGDGLYFANQSTKSLNYCDGGLWTGNTRNKDSIYMFLASVAMGNPFTPPGPVSKPPPKGYDSYCAKAGESHIMNDELIVFSGDQVRLDYILEIERVPRSSTVG